MKMKWSENKEEKKKLQTKNKHIIGSLFVKKSINNGTQLHEFNKIRKKNDPLLFHCFTAAAAAAVVVWEFRSTFYYLNATNQ